MNTDIKPTKEVMQLLNCKKSTFYEHLKKQGIQPIKQGNKSYFNQDQIEAIKNSLSNVQTQTDTNRPSDGHRQTQTDRPPENQTASDKLIEHLKQDGERTRAELKEAQKEIQTLSGQVGHWQGMAQAYQEQNQKLLENQKAEAETVKPETVESDVVDAEIIPEEIPTKISEKKGWWERLWS